MANWNGKLMQLYREAGLTGGTQQRAVKVARADGLLLGESLEITPKGRALLKKHPEPTPQKS